VSSRETAMCDSICWSRSDGRGISWLSRRGRSRGPSMRT
jgi:hypothetical protein